jgi:predicted ester cyclase
MRSRPFRPDSRISTFSIDEMLADGDKVAQRQAHTGIHLGEFAGYQSTGRKIEMTEVSIVVSMMGRSRRRG